MAAAVKEKQEKPEAPVYKTYEDFPSEDLYFYAGLDCIATNSILAGIFDELAEEPQHQVAGPNGKPVWVTAKSILETNEEITKPALEYILDMEINGLKYDVAMNAEISKKMVAEIAALDIEIFKVVTPGINLDSGTEVSNFLYNIMELTPPSFTANNEPSTDGEALLMLAGLNPLNPPKDYKTPDPEKQYLAYMAKRKDINSTHNTFIKTYAKDFVKKDGRIHPSYNLHGTSGFRISGDSPNLTQLPRPKHGYNIRDCYIVDEGYCFIAFDFSSAEVKILAALCKDPGMLKAIEEGLDFHSFSASNMLGIPYEDYIHVLEDSSNLKYKEYKHMRQVAKVLTFSILYGSSAGGIAMQLNISKDEAERMMTLYFTAYPGMKQFIDNSHNEAIWNGKVITPFGQRKNEFGTYPCFKRTAAYNAALRNASNVIICVPEWRHLGKLYVNCWNPLRA